VARFSLEDGPVPRERIETLAVDQGGAETLTPVSWSPDGRQLALVGLGENGQLLATMTIYALDSGEAKHFALPGRMPRTRLDFPRLAWLPDSRNGVVRWADRLLWVDTAAGTISTLLEGLDPNGGLAAWSGDHQWIYLLDSQEEGDIWLASRE
jgi:dipeptidyl aminopeptidase/acylaminoacyl peptidase